MTSSTTSNGRSMESEYYVYLVICSDDSLYCGISKDVSKRVSKHNTGKGAKYTRSRLPVTLVCHMGPFEKSEALRLECLVKKQKRMNKIRYLKEYNG